MAYIFVIILLCSVLDIAVPGRFTCVKQMSSPESGWCSKSGSRRREGNDPSVCCEDYNAFIEPGASSKRINGKKHSKCRSCEELAEPIWGNWTSWSGCNVACNDTIGNRTRARKCNSQWKQCDGLAFEKEECELDEDSCGECWEDWDEWSSWSECTTTCGIGERQRKRSRVTGYRDIGNSSKIACKAVETGTDSCSSECNISGGWSDWSKWMECFDGTRARTRQCNNPEPRGNGAPCQGVDTEFQNC